jgi:hypothetical protein
MNSIRSTKGIAEEHVDATGIVAEINFSQIKWGAVINITNE